MNKSLEVPPLHVVDYVKGLDWGAKSLWIKVLYICNCNNCTSCKTCSDKMKNWSAKWKLKTQSDHRHTIRQCILKYIYVYRSQSTIQVKTLFYFCLFTPIIWVWTVFCKVCTQVLKFFIFQNVFKSKMREFQWLKSGQSKTLSFFRNLQNLLLQKVNYILQVIQKGCKLPLNIHFTANCKRNFVRLVWRSDFKWGALSHSLQSDTFSAYRQAARSETPTSFFLDELCKQTLWNV